MAPTRPHLFELDVAGTRCVVGCLGGSAAFPFSWRIGGLPLRVSNMVTSWRTRLVRRRGKRRERRLAHSLEECCVFPIPFNRGANIPLLDPNIKKMLSAPRSWLEIIHKEKWNIFCSHLCWQCPISYADRRPMAWEARALRL